MLPSMRLLTSPQAFLGYAIAAIGWAGDVDTVCAYAGIQNCGGRLFLANPLVQFTLVAVGLIIILRAHTKDVISKVDRELGDVKNKADRAASSIEPIWKRFDTLQSDMMPLLSQAQSFVLRLQLEDRKSAAEQILEKVKKARIPRETPYVNSPIGSGRGFRQFYEPYQTVLATGFSKAELDRRLEEVAERVRVDPKCAVLTAEETGYWVSPQNKRDWHKWDAQLDVMERLGNLAQAEPDEFVKFVEPLPKLLAA